MEQRFKRNVQVRFKDHNEAINLYLLIEMKYFVMKLLYTHKSRAIIG